MSVTITGSNITAATQFLNTGNHSYAYRRFGIASGRPLLCLQHFTGTLDNWDPAVTDPLALGREMILFDSAGVGRSTGEVPPTVGGMVTHALAFIDGLGLSECDMLGYSLGGMVAQVIAQQRPSVVRRMILVGTAPRGGDDIMHFEKPSLAEFLRDPSLRGYSVLQKIFFAPTESSQAAIRSSHDWRNGGTISTGHQDPKSLPHKWPHSANGSTLRAIVSPTSQRLDNRRSSSTASTTR
jgi:pimeloyl-ACP methyl ester carboxylesterase